MTHSLLSGSSIDHVELYVSDRLVAADWYGRVLGLRTVGAYAHWATELGPLMLSADEGRSMIALFSGAPCPSRSRRSHPRVAFRADGERFLAFVARAAEEGPVYDPEGAAMSALLPIDHGGAFSVYFSDPWGHQIEVTTYDWKYVVEHGEAAWVSASRALLDAERPAGPSLHA